MNETEIVLMGSSNPESNEVFIFDTQTEQIEKVASGGDFNFYSWQSSVVQVKKDKVIALVATVGTDSPALIEFNKGDS